MRRKAPKAATPVRTRRSPRSRPRVDVSGLDEEKVEHDNGPDISDYNEDNSSDEPARKKTKRGTRRSKASYTDVDLFNSSIAALTATAKPPLRTHPITYHRPLLLSGPSAAVQRESLLKWFDSVSASRQMPWRKTWINPSCYKDNIDELRSLLERRAYQVWISEIMLQQTRVTVVIDYWNRWMDRWPTIHDLAQATEDDVVSAWKGLGYYSRAKRILQTAQLVSGDKKLSGLLPRGVPSLEKMPGIGRYTAGAISAIAFGRPSALVDGNVLRVLSRQLGLHGNAKSDKSVIDTLWAAAEALVKSVANDEESEEKNTIDDEGEAVSDRPGRWGQALMELGSTICVPKPNCTACPITATCRAYAEGEMLVGVHKTSILIKDIEESCDLCQLLEEPDGPETAEKPKAPVAKGNEQLSLAAFRFTQKSAPPKPSMGKAEKSKAEMEIIVDHARKFPLKVIKKPVREEETLVCAIRRGNQYLITKRPDKGLLAGMWEFPSHALAGEEETKAATRKTLAKQHMASLVKSDQLRYLGELGSVPWLFSHLKLTMHVHLFSVGETIGLDIVPPKSRWASINEIEEESMGTGMGKCWVMIQDACDQLWSSEG